MTDLVTSRILGEKHMIDIIIYLKTFGARSRSEIYKDISTSPHMKNKLETLEDNGIIHTYCVEGSKRRMNRLTKLGNSYAEKLSELEVLSGGDMDYYRHDVIKDVLSRMDSAQDDGYGNERRG